MKRFTLFTVLFVICCLSVTAAETLLKSSDLSTENSWQAWISKKAKDAGASLTFKDGKAQVKIGSIEGIKDHNVQMLHSLNLDNNTAYKVTVNISSKNNCAILITYRMSKAPYKTYSHKKIKVKGETSSEYTFKLTPVKSEEDDYASKRVLCFNLASCENNEMTISDITITKDQD